MASNIKFFEAKATFVYTVGKQQGSITVGAKSSISKNEDDWKISLALQAGQEVSEKLDTVLSAISLSFQSMKLMNEDD